MGTTTLCFHPKVWLACFVTGRQRIGTASGSQVSHNLWSEHAYLDFPLMSKVCACSYRSDCTLLVVWPRLVLWPVPVNNHQVWNGLKTDFFFCPCQKVWWLWELHFPPIPAPSHWIYNTKLEQSRGKTRDVSGLAKFPWGPAHLDETPSGALARAVVFQVQLRFLWKYRRGW